MIAKEIARQRSKESLNRIYDKYYGSRKPKKGTTLAVRPDLVCGPSRNDLMLKAKAKGILK